MAQAESVGSVYETEVPDVPSESKPPKKNNATKDPDAKTSNNGGNTATGSETGEGGESSGAVGGQGSGGSGSGDAKTGGDGGTGQGSPGNGSNAAGKTGLDDQRQVTPIKHASSTAGDDSSSPLVPILIAIAALAAISIGAVVLRQRRQGGGPGSQVSPKAS